MIAILTKELRGRMRGWAAPVVLTGYVALLALIGLAFFNITNRPYPMQGPEMAALGVQAFSILNTLQTALIMLIAPAMTAGAIAGEKDRQTFDLLQTTRLSAFEIAAGKLTAGIAYMVLLIVATVPLLSMVFLFGGVSAALVTRSIAVQLVTAVLMGTGGLFFSTLVRKTTTATALGLVLALALGFGTVIFGLLAPPIGAKEVSFSQARPGERYVERGPFGTSIRMLKLPNGDSRPILPLAFYLNPGIAIISAATVPGMPGGPIPGSLVYQLERASGSVPVWAGFLGGGAALAALFFAGAWWRLEPRPWHRLIRVVRRRKVAS